MDPGHGSDNALAAPRNGLGDRLGNLLGRLRRQRVAAPPNRGLTEIELLSALGEDGCPVCRALAGTDRRYFAEFLHEGYLEPEAHDHLTRSLGFCLAHGAYLLRAGDSRPQAAFVHQILAHRLRAALARDGGGQLAGMGRAAALRGTIARCPACRARDERAEGLASSFARLIGHPPAAERYAHPGLLCLPHLRLVAAGIGGGTLWRLLESHESAMVAALVALEESRSGQPAAFNDHARAAPLRLTVGHDPALGPTPRPDEPAPPALLPDPVRTLADDMRRDDACPICREIDRAWRGWTAWLDEAAERGDPIDDLLPACPGHVWAVVRTGGPALAAAVAASTLEAALIRIRRATKPLAAAPPAPDLTRRPLASVAHILARGRRPALRAARAALARDVPCPVCRRLAAARDRSLLLLTVLLEEPQHRAAFESGYGLCLRHFARALALLGGGPGSSSPVRNVLRDVQAAKLGRLEWELAEFARKADWRARPEPRGTEQRAPRHAVLRFSGCPGRDAESAAPFWID